jgi:hypothetical protein
VVYFAGRGGGAHAPTPGRGATATGRPGDPTVRPELDATAASPSESTTPTSTGASTPGPSFNIPQSELDQPVSLGESGGAADESGSSFGDFLVGVAVVLLALVALAIAGLMLLVVFAIRRTWRRRHATDARDRVTGAWAQALDHLAEAGVEPKPSATPVEFALRHAPAHGAGDAGPPLMELAHLQTAALFAPDAPSDEDAKSAWAKVDAIDRALDHSLSRWRRWRTRLDPRRLRTPAD